MHKQTALRHKPRGCFVSGKKFGNRKNKQQSSRQKATTKTTTKTSLKAIKSTTTKPVSKQAPQLLNRPITPQAGLLPHRLAYCTMPSSPNYQRDYQREYATQKQRGENGVGPESGSAKRHKLRRLAVKAKKVATGQDLDHVVPLSKGGANTLSNARPKSPHDNRSFKRNADGSMK